MIERFIQLVFIGFFRMQGAPALCIRFFLVCNLFLDILGYKIVISRQETIT